MSGFESRGSDGFLLGRGVRAGGTQMGAIASSPSFGKKLTVICVLSVNLLGKGLKLRKHWKKLYFYSIMPFKVILSS